VFFSLIHTVILQSSDIIQHFVLLIIILACLTQTRLIFFGFEVDFVKYSLNLQTNYGEYILTSLY